ncbi:MAG TPA: NYN domain-containing protein [Candidatus Limnocylindrales bacterium]|nr:NYN domain-containing protein [Candidatus Limnocylindrales bacterium]
MGKNVAVFVDVANIFYAAKAAGTDIDYVTLLKAATAGRDFVRAYAYTGLDPDNENQRNFHAFLARNHYKVVSKDIRKYGDGKVKANLDIELVVDLMKTARNLDIAIVISGDGDFAPAIRAVQEMGVRVEVISFRGNTSSDLIEVADLFTDITQLARVDKASSRSGRRVAGDDEDLSMTEVPDKQTEGTGQRGRGRGRGRGRPGEAEPVAARGRTGGRSSVSRVAASSPEPVEAPAAAGNGALTVLPGEKLSRVAAAASAPVAGPSGDLDDEEITPFDIDPESMPGGVAEGAEGDAEADGEGEAGRRRRRRRGGRGRGRGRGRDGEALPAGETATPDGEALDDEEDDEPDVAPAPRGPRTTPFGAVWDSQLGTPTSAPASLGPVNDDEDFDEPEIPEYLIAEQRRGRQGQGQGGQGSRGGQGRGGPRGGRSSYSSAIDRERYGRGGGGGINRYPDVSGRTGQGGRPSGQPGGSYARQDASYSRPQSAERFDRPAPRSGDPWSEVPPELEEMLRAQLAQSPKARRPERSPAASRIAAAEAAGEIETMTETSADTALETAAPKRRTSSRRKATGEATATAASLSTPTADAATDAVAAEPAAPAAKRRTATRKKVDAAAAPAVESAPEAVATAPKRRPAPRKKADAAESPAPATAAGGDADATPAESAGPKRRTTSRKKADPA